MEEEIIMTIQDLVEELTTENLIDVLEEYNNYVQTFYEEHDAGSYPVSLMEYYNNDYFA